MTQDEIIEAAKEAGFKLHHDGRLTHCGYYVGDKLTIFAELILARQEQPTPSQSVDEREKVVTQKEVDNLFEDNKESFGFNKYFTAKTWFASLSELQPTSHDVQDADVPSQNKLDN